MSSWTYRLIVSTLFVASIAAPDARSQTLNWDPSFTNTATGGGTGPWNTTTTNWFNGTANVAWPGAGNVAVFGGTTAGAVTIAAGGVSADGLTFNTGGYSITGDILTLTGTAPTITVGTGLTGTINSVVAGAAGLTLAGGGTLVLTGANTYTGTTTVLSGTVQVNAGGTPGAATSLLQLGDTAGTLTTAANATFNTSATIAGLNVTTQTAVNTVTIPTGQTLTINGATTIGVPSSGAGVNTVSSLTVTGGGALTIAAGAATFDVGVTSANNNNGTQAATLNMGGLTSFTFTGTGNFRMGFGHRTAGTLTLANTGSSTNSITAGTFSVGNSNGGNNGGASTVNLGGGTNTINANTVSIGLSKSAGVLQFVAGAPAAASVTIAGTAGGASTANISVGVASSATWGGGTARLALAGHPATVQAGTVTVGQLSGATGGTSATNETGQVTFDTGTFTAATLTIDNETGTNASANGMKSSFTLGTTAADTGTLTVNTAFNLGNVVSTTTTTHASQATFTIRGGTATINVDINYVNSNTVNVTLTSILTLAGGTLNMTGHQIGHATGNNRNITTVNMPAAGQTATLMNLGGTGINDAGLTMNGAGTLLLAGTNTYTGPTMVTAGNLDVSGVTGGFQIASGQTLGGSGTVKGAITVNAGGTISPGASPGILSATNAVTMSSGSTMFVELNGKTTPGTDFDQLNLTGGGSINLAGATLTGTIGYAAQPGDSITIITGGTVTNQFAGGPTFNFGGYTGTVTYSGNTVMLSGFTPVPEPAFVLLACGAAAGLAGWHRVSRR